MKDKGGRCRGVQLPLELAQEYPLHLLDAVRPELSSAQVGQRRDTDLFRVVQLDRHVQGGEGCE